MSVQSLCLLPHSVLRQPTQRVERFTHTLHSLIRDMIDTMYAHDGVGIAAPQIGSPLQVFVANPSHRRGHELVVVNPKLEVVSGRTAVTEGCLSIPNVWESVRRAKSVRVKGLDRSGKPLVINAEGLLAIVLQHEYDHLQGQLFIDRLSWLRRCRVALRRHLHRRECA